jgi:hypothetical protein
MSDLVPPMMPDDLDALIQTMERVQQLEAEVARLRLTDEEREAIVTALAFLRGEASEPGVAQDAATLAGLLERTK